MKNTYAMTKISRATGPHKCTFESILHQRYQRMKYIVTVLMLIFPGICTITPYIYARLSVLSTSNIGAKWVLLLDL